MGLKVLARIKLPHIIRLAKSEEIQTSLPSTEDFSQFKITFFPNVESNRDLYDPTYSNDNCFFIEVEAVTDKYDHNNYSLNGKKNYSTYVVPEDDQFDIFKMVNNRLNEFLYYISGVTKMFWIEELNLNPISGAIAKRSEFAFLPPDFEVLGDSKFWDTYADDYQTDVNIVPITPLTQEIADKFAHSVIIGFEWTEYLKKAKVALFSSKYTEFIIYCAIVSESFIKSLVSFFYENKKEKDIVLEKLIKTGNSRIVESYYKIILKYITGKSLHSEEPELYNNLSSIFKLRNSIMHQGAISPQDFKKAALGNITELDFDLCLDMLTKLQKAIKKTLNLLTTKQGSYFYTN